MDETSKENLALAVSWIEHQSQEKTREFRIYWENNSTPQDAIQELLPSDPDRVAEIIVRIAKEIENNEDLETKLICGLIYDFEHFAGKEDGDLLRKKLTNQSIYNYLTQNKA